MTAEERAKQLETQLEAEKAARAAAEAAAKEAQEAQQAAEAALVTAERAGVVTEALAGRTVPEAVKTAMTTAAQTADTVDAAREAVKALADAYTVAGGNGNNHIPQDGKQTVDAVAEAHREIGVTA